MKALLLFATGFISLLYLSGAYCEPEFNAEEELRRLYSKKETVPVVLNAVDIGSIVVAWEYDLNSSNSIKRYVMACIGGYYVGVGNQIGKDLVKRGEITEHQYQLLRTNCVGHEGILIKTTKMWSSVWSIMEADGEDIRTLLPTYGK